MSDRRINPREVVSPAYANLREAWFAVEAAVPDPGQIQIERVTDGWGAWIKLNDWTGITAVAPTIAEALNALAEAYGDVATLGTSDPGPSERLTSSGLG